MSIISLILLHKFYVTSGLKIFSKLLSTKTAEKYDKFK